MTEGAIETPRLFLIPCTIEIVEKVLEGDDALATHLGITIPPQWTEFGEQAFRWTYSQLQSSDKEPRWHTYLPVIRQGKILAGSCGYKGHPVNGNVEIGYEVAAQYRGIGLASEIAMGLIEFAWGDESVTCVTAHTLAVPNASCRVLEKAGMTRVATIEDPEDGTIWKWAISRNNKG